MSTTGSPSRNAATEAKRSSQVPWTSVNASIEGTGDRRAGELHTRVYFQARADEGILARVSELSVGVGEVEAAAARLASISGGLDDVTSRLGGRAGAGADTSAAAAVAGLVGRLAGSLPEFGLATERLRASLYSDATGGGHLWPRLPGKTAFPEDWTVSHVMQEISDVATDPDSSSVVRGGKTIITGTRDGVDIRVNHRQQDGRYVTGYPTNLPMNP
jgi:hypothetical protein